MDNVLDEEIFPEKCTGFDLLYIILLMVDKRILLDHLHVPVLWGLVWGDLAELMVALRDLVTDQCWYLRDFECTYNKDDWYDMTNAQELIHKVNNMLCCMVFLCNEPAGHVLPPPIRVHPHHPLSVVWSEVDTSFRFRDNTAVDPLHGDSRGSMLCPNLTQLFFPN